MAWMNDPEQRRELLCSMLDDAGLNYKIESNPSGWFYATLGYETRGGAPVIVTAIIQELVLRITAHGILDPMPEPARNDVNLQWGFGRLSEADGRVNATVCLYLGGKQPTGEQILTVIEHLVDTGEVLQQGNGRQFDLTGGLLNTARIADALGTIGVSFVARQGGDVLAARFPSDSGPDVIVEWMARSGTLLGCRARHASEVRYGDDLATVAVVERMNANLSFGCMIRRPESSIISYEAVVPVAWHGMPPQLLDWWIDKAIFVLDQLAADAPRLSSPPR